MRIIWFISWFINVVILLPIGFFTKIRHPDEKAIVDEFSEVITYGLRWDSHPHVYLDKLKRLSEVIDRRIKQLEEEHGE